MNWLDTAYFEKYGSMPDAPEFESIRNADGSLQNQYVLGNNLNTDYLDMMRQEGLRQPGEQSTWRQLQQQQINRQAGDVQAQTAQAQAQQMDQLAMRGGVNSGAASLLAQDGMRQSLQNQQNVFGQGLQANLADEQNRLNSLNSLGQAELNTAQFNQNVDQYNIQNTLGDISQERAFDSNVFDQNMNAWASIKTADAAPSGGGKK